MTDLNSVKNKFVTDEEQARIDEDPYAVSRDPIPLFSVDLILEEGSADPQFSVYPGDVVSNIMQIFDLGIEKLQEIAQIQQKLMPHLFKKDSSMYLKAAKRPKIEPLKPDPNDKRAMEDENLWVWEAYKTMRSELMKAIYPMDDFISCSMLSSMKQSEYMLNVEQYIKTKDPSPDEADPPEIEDLRKDVIFHLEQEKRLAEEIPELVVVSMFQVDCRDFRGTL